MPDPTDARDPRVPSHASSIGAHHAWREPPDIVRWCLHGKITAADARALREYTMTTQDWRYVLIDASAKPLPDRGARGFWVDPRNVHPAHTVTVIYGAAPAIRTMVGLVIDLLEVVLPRDRFAQVRLVADEAAALALIEDHRRGTR